MLSVERSVLRGFPISSLMGILLLLLFSCGDADNEYDINNACYFSFDTQLHNTSIVTHALNPLASGIFVGVSVQTKNGVLAVNAELNDGKTQEQTLITTARENYMNYILGAANGLVIGYSSLGNGLFAFDRQCPNCIQDYALYKYQLQWNNNGQWLACGTCKRKYDLNNNGFIVEGDKGHKLIRYKAYYDGAVLMVKN